MITNERICSHNIEFWYRSHSKNAVPDESELEHVQKLLNENFVEGELCLNKVINNREYEFRGWWKILKG